MMCAFTHLWTEAFGKTAGQQVHGVFADRKDVLCTCLYRIAEDRRQSASSSIPMGTTCSSGCPMRRQSIRSGSCCSAGSNNQDHHRCTLFLWHTRHSCNESASVPQSAMLLETKFFHAKRTGWICRRVSWPSRLGLLSTSFVAPTPKHVPACFIRGLQMGAARRNICAKTAMT